MLDELMTSPIAWLVLAVISVVSLGYAICCQILNKERKEITYAQKTNTLIYNQKKSFEKINVFYEEKPIENLYVSKIAIWNSGNRVLKESDFVKDNFLEIALGDNCSILESNIITKTEESNSFKLTKTDDREIIVNFDYAEKNDGIVLQMIHTGIKNDINLSCKIVGGKPLKNFSKEKRNPYSLYIRKKILRSDIILFLASTCYFILGVVSLIYGIHKIYNPPIFNQKTVEELQKASFDSAILNIILGGVCLLLSLFMFYTIKKYYFGIPTKLRKAYYGEVE